MSVINTLLNGVKLSIIRAAINDNFTLLNNSKYEKPEAGIPLSDINTPPPAFKIILAIGQSNAQGQYSTSDSLVDVSDPLVFQFGSNSADTTRYRTIFQAADPLQWTGDAGAGTVSPATWMGKFYSRITGCPVIIVPCAVGATALVNSRWAPGNPGGDLYENAIAQANLAIAAAKELAPGSEFSGIYMVQGEADGGNSVTQAAYAAALSDLITGMRTRITDAANSWFLLGSMPYETMQYWANTIPIHYAQKQVAFATPRCLFVDGPIGQTLVPGSNRHYTTKGVRILGIALAQSAILAPKKLAAVTVPTVSVPSNLAQSGVTTSGFTVTWNADIATDFIVELSSNGGTSYNVQSRLWGTTKSHTFTGLSPATQYKVRIKSNFIGNLSAYSTVLNVTTTAVAGVGPSITVQPTSQTVVEGSTATFSVTATGDPTLTYQWSRNPGGNTVFTNISGATGSSYTTPNTTLSGGTANNSDTYRVVVTNSTNSVTSATVGLTVTANSVNYNFESDTVGNPPSNITSTTGTLVVDTPSISGWNKGMRSTVTSGSTNTVSNWAVLNSLQSLKNQSVTWRRGRTAANQSREGFVLRHQVGQPVGGGYTGGEQGYWFQYNGQSGNGRIYALKSTGPVGLGSNAPVLAEVDDRMFRATANESTLTLDYSDNNGTTWTNLVTVTDTTFNTAGGVALLIGANCPDPSKAIIDNITQTAI